MAEYIDREALLQDIEQSVVFSARTGTESAEMRAARKIVDRIRNAPAADVAPVKHGKWIWDPNGTDWNLGAWECSECACRNNNLPINNKINPLVFSGSKYCPNCGAKMDSEG